MPTSTPSTSAELQSLKVLTPSTRSKVSQLLDTSTERHKAALKIFALHFSKEELATSNCSGTSEKKQLDPKRLTLVKCKRNHYILVSEKPRITATY